MKPICKGAQRSRLETGERIFVIVQDQLGFMRKGTEMCVAAQSADYWKVTQWLKNTSRARLPRFKASLNFLGYVTLDESLLLLRSGILFSYREEDSETYFIDCYED